MRELRTPINLREGIEDTHQIEWELRTPINLAVSAILADAAARAARYTVHVNARELRDAAMRERLYTDIDDILKHCARLRESIEAYVYEHLEKD